MLSRPKPNELDRFRYRDIVDSETLITSCPKGIFSIHPNAKRCLKDVFVVFYENRWHLVDADLYCYRTHVHGLLRADLYEGVDIEGNHFLLISTFPLSGVTTAWKKSVLNVVDKARKGWVEIKRLNNQVDIA